MRISHRQSLWAHKHTVVLKTFDGQICYIYCIFPELLPNNAAESRCFDRAFDVSFLSTLPAGLVEVNLCLNGDASDLVFCGGGLALEAGEITWVMGKEAIKRSLLKRKRHKENLDALLFCQSMRNPRWTQRFVQRDKKINRRNIQICPHPPNQNMYISRKRGVHGELFCCLWPYSLLWLTFLAQLEWKFNPIVSNLKLYQIIEGGVKNSELECCMKSSLTLWGGDNSCFHQTAIILRNKTEVYSLSKVKEKGKTIACFLVCCVVAIPFG